MAVMGSARGVNRFVVGGIVLAILVFTLSRNSGYEIKVPKPIKEVIPPAFSFSLKDAPINPNRHNEDMVTPDVHRFKNPDMFLGEHLDKVKALPHIGVNETKRTCTWTPEEMEKQQFMWGPESEWYKNEMNFSDTWLMRNEFFWQLEHRTVPWDLVKDKFHGRGILTAAGHINSLKRLAVALRQLRRLRSKLPVEVAYWGNEIDSDKKEWLKGIYPNIFWLDLSRKDMIFRTHSPEETKYGHFHLKTAAVLNSRFAEILLLDSDNLPVQAPDSLFDTPTFQEYGTIFWPDMARTRPQNPIWSISHTPCRMDEYEQESGQMLVDKTRFWYHLQMSAWMNENGPYLLMLLGDKDMFRFAWHTLKTEFGTPNQWLTSIGMYHDNKYCGHTYAQHHPDGSVAFLHRGLYKLHNTATLKYFRDHGGMFAHYKQTPFAKDPGRPIHTKWSFDTVDGLQGGKVWSCMDLVEDEHHPIDELIPGIEELWRDELDGYWAIDDPNEV